MADVEGCNIPEDLYYWIEKHVWAKPENEVVLIGLSDVAQSLAGKIIVVNLKSAGKTLARGKSGGTLESGKWVGSIPTPVAGEVIEVNEAAKANPSLVNDDPYGKGWLLKIKPSNWEEDKNNLETGESGVASYRAKLLKEGIKCAK
ncbi:MAG: glycine cleavage system protein GcvH [Firmicutes bacterium]|jgi:glycine cleavage system H protein|uniref:Glycine cleavage system H protein n=1 Tax=Sulfobacillus benefaciens TaxID=453960 RepID=A0A2T2XBC0_9FIRM|nr:glycine cleavage system protein GcvH [Bacillota bacterium]MCL5012428.1 glycine cleavage system protein GcvH [Bacillota bacterium]PSR31811.1 MAG: glycine cleavage system protein H [Sulfobacillus benefaciens]